MTGQPLPYIQVTVAFNGKDLDSRTFLDRELIIGRGSDCHIQLDNPGASRQHAKIVRDGNTLTVFDLDSGNGTFINGKSVTKAPLNPGDTLGISKFTLTVVLTGESLDEVSTRPADISAAPTPEGATVFLRPAERSKISQHSKPGGAPTQAKITSIAPAEEKKAPVGLIFVAGMMLGIVIGWLLHG